MSSVDQSNIKVGRIFSYDYKTAGKGPALWGLFGMIPIFLILGIWASFAPLSSAAIASGEVVLKYERKTVQHLEGGIVDEVLISEGETVERGQSVLVIRDVAQRTKLNSVEVRLASALTLKSRLIAERDKAEAVEFLAPENQINLPNSKLSSLRITQTRLFETRRTNTRIKIDMIKASKESKLKQIDGLNRKMKALHKQLALTVSERVSVKTLQAKGLATNQRVKDIDRNLAKLQGEEGLLAASLAELEQNAATADIEIINIETQFQNDVLEKLQKVELNLQELEHQLTTARDQLARTIVKAPTHGVIIGLNVHTKGAVVDPGQHLMDIVPEDDSLIVEARLKPSDIDLVEKGTSVKVFLSAYKARKIPALDGEVLNVSADVLVDAVTGERYFKARVFVSEEMLSKLNGDVELYPGMPAEVFLLAGEHTVADYLLSPITDATYRAFREE